MQRRHHLRGGNASYGSPIKKIHTHVYIFSTSATCHHGFIRDLVSIQKSDTEILNSGAQLSDDQSHATGSTTPVFSLSGTFSSLTPLLSLSLLSLSRLNSMLHIINTHFLILQPSSPIVFQSDFLEKFSLGCI